MTKNLSNGAVQLLDVIEKMPGHFREDYCKVADLSRSMWNRLSGELRRTGRAHTERTTINRNGREVTDFKWYAGTATKKPVKPARKGKTPPLTDRRKRKIKAVTSSKKAAVKSLRAGQWTDGEVKTIKTLWTEGKTDAEISLVIGRTANAIRTKRKQLRWVAGKGKKRVLPTEQEDKKKEIPRVEKPVKKGRVVGHIHSAYVPTLDEIVKSLIDEKLDVLTTTLEIRNEQLSKLAKRVTALEQSLTKNEKSDDDTKNTLGDIKKTLSGLLDKL